MISKRIAIIGAGFSGIASATYLANKGYEVHLYEKHAIAGGRARQLKTDNGYTFDMGPSWYWMPEIFENYFKDFGKNLKDYYQLVKLDPQFEMIFANSKMSIPSSYDNLKEIFETKEKGAAERLDDFMADAQKKYEIGMGEFVQKPCLSLTEFASLKILKNSFKLNLFTNFSTFVRRYFTHPDLITLMEFPVIFLGAAPKDIPALYSLMNYGGMKLGTFYPIGGMGQIIHAMVKLAQEKGVKFHYNANVEKIVVENNIAKQLIINNETINFDHIISSADYHFTETKLLDKEYRNYNEEYWDKKTFAPSCLIYYLGINKKLDHIPHHTLFFENSLEQHTHEIYTDKKWPTKPLFYMCCPSKTDDSVAPIGHENLFLLMPLATGIKDDENLREKYFNDMITRIEEKFGLSNIKANIDYKKSYCIDDFTKDYGAFKGNAYGLANTLQQTAFLKPTIKNKKVKNLYYTGQLTVPGPGVPPSLISGKIVANEIINS